MSDQILNMINRLENTIRQARDTSDTLQGQLGRYRKLATARIDSLTQDIDRLNARVDELETLYK